jgi:flagellar biosynthesis protein FlhB
MTSLGIIMIGTGLIVWFSGRTMIKGTRKMVDRNGHYGVDPDKENTEREFTGMVKKAMRILYLVGGTCILIGIILTIFGSM